MPKTKLKLRHIVVAVITIFGLLYITVFAVSKYYLNTTEIKGILVSKLEENLHRKVSLSDNLSLSIGWDMSPHVQINSISISNTSWGQQPNFLTVERLEINVSLLKLLFKQIYVDSLTLIKPKINLETSGDNNNWNFENKADSKKNKDSNIKLDVRNIKIVDGELTYRNNEQTRVLKINNLDIFNADNMLKLKKISLNISSSDLKGNLSINKQSYGIEGKLESNLLSLNDLSAGGSSNSSGEYNIPSIELPIEQLKKSDMGFTVAVKKLVLGKIILENANLQVTTYDKVLRIGLVPEASIAHAKLDFDLAYDLKPKTPTLDLSLKTTAIKLENFLPVKNSAIEIKSNLSSSGANLNTLVNNLNGKFLATATPGEYLNGDASFTNLLSNIFSSMITFEKAKPSTHFECAVVHFKVNNGVAVTSNGIALEATTVNVVGSGRIDLRNGRINFSINPKNLSKNPLNVNEFSLAQLIDINGTITNPVINLNPMSLINSTLNKTIISSFAAGIPGGIAAIAESLSTKENTNANPNVCKAALEM